MLYIIIPFRSATITSNWRGVCDLLGQTVRSACNQTHPAYRVIVVGHERPDGIVLPPQCEFVCAPFLPPVVKDNEGKSPPGLEVMHADKGRKLLFGLALARQDPGSFFMILDADDLVSARLAGFVAAHSENNGWYFDRGYRWNAFTPFLLFSRRRFYEECGSSYILRSDRAPFPETVDYSKGWEDYYVRRYVTHAYIGNNMTKLGYPLDPLPFPGAIYRFHGLNMYASTLRKPDSWARILGRCLLKGRWLTRRLRNEFGFVLRSEECLGCAQNGSDPSGGR